MKGAVELLFKRNVANTLMGANASSLGGSSSCVRFGVIKFGGFYSVAFQVTVVLSSPTGVRCLWS